LISRFVFVVAAALGGVALAQESPVEVTDGEIARYKSVAQQACQEAGLARKDPQARVEGFCKCVMNTLEQNISRPEWQQLYFYSSKKDEKAEQAILARHRAKLEVCRPK